MSKQVNFYEHARLFINGKELMVDKIEVCTDFPCRPVGPHSFPMAEFPTISLNFIAVYGAPEDPIPERIEMKERQNCLLCQAKGYIEGKMCDKCGGVGYNWVKP